MRAVVDTNVPVVANGNSEQASPRCVRTCAIQLRELMEGGKLVLDARWLILKEYMANLKSSGQPGNGDAFLKWVLTNHKNPDRCELVSITPIGDEFTDFEEFPRRPNLTGFHGDDRKFVAVAMAHPEHPVILEAVDTEWWKLRDALSAAGVKVEFLCPGDIETISARQVGH
jgi:hypothetical protein